MWFWFAIAAAACWAISNNFDSLLILRYEKNPLVVLWFTSWIVLASMLVLMNITVVQTSWWLIILFAGATTYLGDCFYYWILDRIDISVSSAMWAILSVQLSIVGFIWFGDRWTAMQVVGAILVFLGILFLAYWHRIQSLRRTVGLLTIGATLYLPFWVIQKSALDAGVTITAVFFWELLANCVVALVVPLMIPSYRKRITEAYKRFDFRFWFIALVIVIFWFTALIFTYSAYALGSLSLVSIASNVQPFFIIVFAWLLLRIAPSFAPRELLTGQSVGIKCISFSIVFIGLALLVISL